MTWCVGRGPRSACGSVCLALASRTYAIGWQVWWDLGKGGAVLVHVGTNDVDKKGSEEVMGRYRELVRELKRVRVGQIVLSGILPVRGGYTRNNRRISINLRLQALCQAEGVGFLNMWEHFEQGDGLFSKDGLHLNKRGAAVLGKGFLRALGDGIGQLSLN